MQFHTKSLLTLLVAAILGSSVVVLTKIGLREIPPIQFLFYRLLLTTIFLLPILKLRGHRLPTQIKNKIWLISLLPAANFLLYIFGINLTTATITSTIYAFVPVMTAIIAHYFINERLNITKSAGIALGLLGTSIVVALPLLNGSGGGGNLWGNLLILSGAISWAAYPVISKRLQADYTPLVLTTAMMLPATIISGLFSGWQIFVNGFPSVSLTTWMIVVYSALITVIYYLLVHRLIQQISSVMGTMVLYIQPITAFLWAAPILGEKLTPALIIGGALTIGGAYLVSKVKA